jgi:outer membrane protein assembly factor BamB
MLLTKPGTLLIFVLLLAPSHAVLADGYIASPEPDWPQWRGVRRDGISTETGLQPTWPAGGPRLIWTAENMGTGWSSPIIVRNRLYITGDIGDELVVFALDLNGEVVWKTTNGASWEGSYPGARACCCYSAGKLYHLNAHGRLVCLNAETGREEWAQNILNRFDARNITWALSECLLVDGDRLIVTPGGKRALMAALDRRDGSTIWVTPPLEDDLTSYSSPILFELNGRRLIASCSSHHGFGVDAQDGQLLWKVPLSNPHKVNTATPIYGSGALFYVTPYAQNGRLYRLQPNEDQLDMRAQEVWQSPLDTVTGSGILIDNTLYAAGYRRNKWWMGIDWTTGEVTCEQQELTTGAAIYADGRLYCLDDKGTAGLLEPQGDQLKVAGKFRFVDRRVRDAWAHPVLLRGRLYLRYHDKLCCYDVGSK